MPRWKCGRCSTSTTRVEASSPRADERGQHDGAGCYSRHYVVRRERLEIRAATAECPSVSCVASLEESAYGGSAPAWKARQHQVGLWHGAGGAESLPGPPGALEEPEPVLGLIQGLDCGG